MKTSIVIFNLLISVFAWGQVTHKEMLYKQVDSVHLMVDAFFVEGDSSPQKLKPSIAFFHGGGWTGGDPSEFHEACKRYAKKGFVTFSFEYRLSRQHDGTVPHPKITPIESVKDARSAIRWIRLNATIFNLNPDKIAVGGQSAGGQLALATALVEDVNEATDDLSISPVPNALLLYSSCVNTIIPWCEYLMPGMKEALWTISPYHNLVKKMPPAIAFHGKNDQTSDYWTVAFFERKTKALGNEFVLVTYEDSRHYLAKGNPRYAEYFDEEIMQRTDEFLKKYGFME